MSEVPLYSRQRYRANTSQGTRSQVLAVALHGKSLEPLKLFPLRSEAEAAQVVAVRRALAKMKQNKTHRGTSLMTNCLLLGPSRRRTFS